LENRKEKEKEKKNVEDQMAKRPRAQAKVSGESKTPVPRGPKGGGMEKGVWGGHKHLINTGKIDRKQELTEEVQLLPKRRPGQALENKTKLPRERTIRSCSQGGPIRKNVTDKLEVFGETPRWEKGEPDYVGKLKRRRKTSGLKG